MREVDKLARQIARGDRSVSTARAYLAALEAAAPSPRTKPAQGPYVRVRDHGEVARLVALKGPRVSLTALEEALYEDGFSKDGITYSLVREVERIVPVVDGELPEEVLLTAVAGPKLVEGATVTLDGLESWVTEFQVEVPRDWDVVEALSPPGRRVALKACVPGASGHAVVVVIDASTGEVVGRGLLREGDDEIEFYDDVDLTDDYFAAVQGDLERRLVRAVEAARQKARGRAK